MNKIKQYIANRFFDEELANHLKKDNILIKKNKNGIAVEFPELINLRANPSSDFSVFLQVFYAEQYSLLAGICNFNQIQVSTIVDLGANVGFTSIYLNRRFKTAKIIALEPDEENFKVLRTNTQYFKNIITKNAAIWSHQTKLSPSFDEESDWGKTFLENKDSKTKSIEAVTINHIVEEHQLQSIDILKIDVEGAEKQIFESDLSFLKRVKVIAIEIHEHVIEKEKIHAILRANHFILVEYGELSIGINKNLTLADVAIY